MSGGKITIRGSAGGCTGKEMETGGKIAIDGDAGPCTGTMMYNGEIVVGGNAGERTGSGMHGGAIRVGGNIASLAIIMEGDIWQGGVKIVEQGRRMVWN